METSLRFYETLIFVLNWILPPLMMAATAGLVIWKVRKEHYGEKISLEPSPEERKLRELAEQGRIRNEEAERLLEQCNALPEIRKEAPEPDLSLKLTSLISRIYALTKIVFLIGASLCLGTMAALDLPGCNLKFSPAGSREVVLFLSVVFLILLGSVLEWIAAGRVCRGSFAARNLLIALWILDFAAGNFLFAGHSILYLILSAGCGIFCLYVLLFRKDAVSKVTFCHAEPALPVKCGFGVLAAAALILGIAAPGPGLFALLPTVNYHTSSFSRLDRQPEWKELLLIQGSSDEETLEVLRKIAENLKKTQTLPCRIRTFQESAATGNANTTLPVLIFRGTLSEPKPLTISLPSIGEVKVSGTKRSLTGLLKGKHSLAFGFRSLNSNDFHAIFHKGLNLPPPGLHFHGSSAVSSGSARRRIELAAEGISKRLAEILRNTENLPKVRFPEEEIAPLPPSLFSEIPEWENRQPIYRAQGIGIRFCEVYLFKRSEYQKDVRKISAILTMLGFSQKEHWDNNILLFEKPGSPGGDREQIHLLLPDPANNPSLSLTVHPDFGILFHEVLSAPETKPDPAFLERFRKNDPRSFVLSRGLSTLNGETLNRTFDTFLARKDLSYEDRIDLLESLDRRKRQMLAGRYTDFFRAMADETLADRKNPAYSTRVERLFHILRFSDSPAPERAWLLRRLGADCVTLRIPAGAPESGNEIEIEGRHKVPYLGNSVLFLNLEFENGNPPIFCCFSILPMGNNHFQTYCNGVSSQIKAYADLKDRTGTLSEWKMTGNGRTKQWLRTRGITGGPPADFPPKPGEVRILLIPEPAENCYLFQVRYLPK